MTLFMLACLVLIGAAFLAEAVHPDGVGIVRPAVWYAAVAGLGLWLLLLPE